MNCPQSQVKLLSQADRKDLMLHNMTKNLYQNLPQKTNGIYSTVNNELKMMCCWVQYAGYQKIVTVSRMHTACDFQLRCLWEGMSDLTFHYMELMEVRWGCSSPKLEHETVRKRQVIFSLPGSVGSSMHFVLPEHQVEVLQRLLSLILQQEDHVTVPVGIQHLRFTLNGLIQVIQGWLYLPKL